ncbi:head GIN domain-containing protein [Aquimarina sediminis]|uniref:head GIN domain-containing protein n=1 Tax=Aquimarina sediminis TaxID=2070536 RepID=UPI000CA009AD|nr:head GIN domain-containing protein [Aquimarina sediminis]
MKKIVFLFVLLTVIFGQAQDVVTKKVGDFSELKVFDKIKVILIHGEENKVEISGIKRQKVDVVLKGEVLKIKMSLNNTWDENNTNVTVYYSDLSKIDVNEGARVTVQETLKSLDLDLRAQEGAEIIATIESDKLIARAVTGGELNLKGKVKEQEVTVKAGGQFMSKDLKTETTQVKISAGGRANIYASKYVKANTNAGGTIKIYGNPKEMDTQKLFGGKIIEVN